jgi:hypothetical protein
MIFKILGAKLLNVFLISAEAGSSFGVYSVSHSLTPLGWVLIIVLPILSICGFIYLVAKLFKKTKLK